MAIRPTDIRRKEFKNSLRGYDANQVDDFLDAVADEFERTYSENVRLREESSSLRSRLEQFDELEGSIRAALVHAEQAANDLRRTATQEAESVRQTANREAESARQTANREAELTINDAKARSHRMLADTAERVERVQESYHALRNAKQLFASDFRHLLKSYMEVMDSADVATAREIESSLRERVDLESIAAARLAAEAESRDVQEELPVEEPADDSTAEHEPFEEAEDQATQRIDMSPPADEAPFEEEEAPLAEEPVFNQEPESQPVSETEVSPESEPEVEEPEVEPSTAEGALGESASSGEPVSEAPEAEAPETETPETSEQDEATLARDSGSHEFWEDAERKDASGNGEEGRISRASRFLRRRG